jgi:F1F0 ATPase subunit 2
MELLEFASLGAIFNAAYLGALAWNVRLYCLRFTPLALLLHLVRIIVTAAIFLALARAGAAPLLSGLVGFELTRIVRCRATLISRGIA